LKDTSRWTRIDRVTELAPFFVIGRGGHDAPEAESAPLDLPEVSSTRVREAVRSAESVRGLLSASVEAYVAAHHLYRAQP
jgi:nicotinic acid mononucleotide adenylyltransferase